MNTFLFYSLSRAGSLYPDFHVIKEETLSKAIHAFAVQNDMRIVEIHDDDVWVELPCQVIAKYSVEEKQVG